MAANLNVALTMLQAVVVVVAAAIISSGMCKQHQQVSPTDRHNEDAYCNAINSHFCQGTALGFDVAATFELCESRCMAMANCQYLTWQPNEDKCFLFSDCSGFIDCPADDCITASCPKGPLKSTTSIPSKLKV